MKFRILLVLFVVLIATICAGCATCGDCTDCSIKEAPKLKSAAAPKAAPAPLKVQAPSLKAPITPDLPKCEVITEYWGSSTYLKLTDINGYTYKLSRPTAGTSNRYTTRTGWYLINSEGEIIRFQDTRKVRR